MGPILYNLCWELRKNGFLAAIVQHLFEKLSSRSWVRRGVISCARHTSFYEVNDSVVKFERGKLVRVSGPPLVYSWAWTGEILDV